MAAGQARHAHLAFVLCEHLLPTGERKDKLQLMTLQRALNSSDGIARLLNLLARLMTLDQKEATRSLAILEELLGQEDNKELVTSLVDDSRSSAFWLATHYAGL